MSEIRSKVPNELFVLLQGRQAGTLRRDQANASYVFTYDASWRDDPTAFPLSLSLPLASQEHEGIKVFNYIRGLLPDNESRLNTLAHQYGIAPDDFFSLLAYLGEDCPGAVQFVRPERLSALMEDVPEPVEWLTDGKLATILRDLGTNNTHHPGLETGQFSLPGALAKIALTWYPDAHQWGYSSGRVATTHIIKPPIRGVRHHNENEHLCLQLARQVNCPAASSYILRIEDQTAIVVERFDRRREDDTIVRLHQEDLSQALGANTRLKYAGEGAPGITDIVNLLRDQSVLGLEDAYQFLRAVAFNWTVAGTDAHPRNYAVLIAPRGDIRLAPLYDISSALFLQQNRHVAEFRMAMAVGGYTRIGDINRAAWEAQAKQLRLSQERLFDEIESLISAIGDGVSEVVNAAITAGIDEGFCREFSRQIQDRAIAYQRLLER